MSDYINREAAIELFQRLAYDDWNQGANTTWANAYSEAVEMIAQLPAVDVAEVRHGRWVDMGDFISCSCCNATRMKEFLSDYGVVRRLDARTTYCPSCGAVMDGGQEA